MSKEKKETIEGVEYTFKKLPPREWARLRDRCKNRHGNILEENMMSEVLEKIVVDPPVKLDDFEDWGAAKAVADAAALFCLGGAAEE